MKHISESIIGRTVSVWPNPYGLTKKDAKWKIKGWPLEIITLALYETYLARKDFDLNDLQRFGLDCAFSWGASEDGMSFWNSIFDKNFDIFYKTYTPAKLKERIKNQPR
jgi:hypothetical protein